MMSGRRVRWFAATIVACAFLPIACASRAPLPPPVTAPRYPEFVYPAVPPQWARDAAAQQHERAWQFLQGGDLRNAERGFSGALRGTPGFYPAETGLAYINLAEKDLNGAITRFDRALAQAADYVPALIGRGDALLAASRDREAITTLERAVTLDPTLSDIQRRIDLVKFRLVQRRVEDARKAAAAKDLSTARGAYREAIDAAPDSAILYRELAALELMEGDVAAARGHLEKAIELDPSDARAHTLAGEMYESLGDFESAAAAYERAQSIEPNETVARRLEVVRAGARLASLPAEFVVIRDARAVSRADLAALVGVRLGDLVAAAGKGQAAVFTDARGHWASSWILAVTGARIMDVFPNHTFQPAAIVRRGELGNVANRLLELIAARDPALARKWRDAQGPFTDVRPGHPNYTAASRVLAAGVLPLLENNTFQLQRPVSGVEAVAAIERIEALYRAAAAGRVLER